MSLSSKIKRVPIVLGDARWWPFYIQRRFMQPRVRRNLAHLASRWRPRMTEVHSDQPAVQQNHIHQLTHDGITHLGLVLSATQCETLRTYFQNCDVLDPYRAERGMFKPLSGLRHPQSHIAHHLARDVVLAPGLLELANKPEILQIVERFLGCKPTLSYLATWWSYPTDIGAQQAEHFHRDVDDWRFVKLFVYLTDVGQDNGPHMYVTRSSASPSLAEIRRFTNEEVLNAFGAENILELTGQPGQAFLEDTFGIHKGQPVKAGHRLIFQAVYSMYPLPYGPKHPVADLADVQALTKTTLDPWINRFYLRT